MRGVDPDIFRYQQPARALASASSQYLNLGVAVANEPLTMACWWNATNTSAAHILMSIGTTGGTARWQLVENQTTGAGNACQVTAVNSSATSASSALGSITAGTWHHYAGVFASSSSRIAYLDGTAGTENTTAVITGLSSTNTTLIGIRINAGSAGAFANGILCLPFIWNVALNASELKWLASGGEPWLLRPQNIVSGVNMQTLRDVYADATWTNTNGATLAEPRRFSRKTSRRVIALSGATFNPAWANGATTVAA